MISNLSIASKFHFFFILIYNQQISKFLKFFLELDNQWCYSNKLQFSCIYKHSGINLKISHDSPRYENLHAFILFCYLNTFLLYMLYIIFRFIFASISIYFPSRSIMTCFDRKAWYINSFDTTFINDLKELELSPCFSLSFPTS